MSKNNKKRRPLKSHGRDMLNCIFMLKQVAKFSPGYLVFTVIEGIINGVCQGLLSAVMMKIVFDRLEENVSFWSVGGVIIAMMVIWTVRNGYGYLYGWAVKQWWTQRIHKGMHELLFKKARELDLSCYDDPEFYNDFVWALNESDGRAANTLGDVRILITYIISSVTVFSVIFSIDTVIVLISLISALVEARVQIAFNKVGKETQEEQMPADRRIDYVGRALTLPEYAKEVRIGHAPELIMKQYGEAMDEREKLIRKFAKKSLPLSIFSTTFNSAVHIAIYAYLVWKLFNGHITLGDYAAVTNSVWNLFWGFSQIAKHYAKFANHGLFAEKYRTFLEYEPKIVGGDKEAGEVTSLAFESVSFRYPGTEKDSLSDVSFTINKGERVAIVGYNGAGKTTLIKLLLRLYDPTEGAVLINGENIKEYGVEGYRDRFGTVFQDFQIFASSIAENVIAGSYTPDLEGKVVDALTKSTFLDKLEKLEKGVDTPLTREFDEEGVNLSGGEAQKVAIARVFAHGGDVIVMDEPSSALDPMSEYELNQTILSYAQDKTVIFISHRLSTTRMADRILMFADGKLIEDGSHEELMKADGKYAEMFNMQAEKYTGQKY